MRIVFVRHGEPDYARDCLTETGNRQAAAAAERLKLEGITRIYASPMGRAAETAAYTARLLDLPVHTLPYMHEISWGGQDLPCEGHPWTLGERLIDRDDFDFAREDWRLHPYFAGNACNAYLDGIGEAFDALLASHGYERQGTRYLCRTGAQETFAVFSHGGSGACVLSRLLNLPFPYVCTVFPYDFTSVIILNFPVRPGEPVHPRVELFNDAAHIRGLSDGLHIQQKAD